MTTFLRGLLAAALASALVAGPAAAASVTVRVEGAAATLVPQTAVRTVPGWVAKDGDPNHRCPAENAIGALEQATAGDWDGTWGSFGYLVEEIRGERHDAATQAYWRLSVDGADATAGVCDLTLRDGQELVLSPASYADPTAPAPALLELTAPPAARAGEPVAVTVQALDPAGQGRPQAGATVTAGTASAQTDAQGRAELRIATPGEVELRAEAPGAIRDTGERLCLAGPAGGCGLPAVAPSAPPAPVAPAGAADTLAPAVLVTSLREGARFSTRRAPRAFAGVAGVLRRDAAGRLALAGADPSGLRAVKLRLTRRAGERCATYSPTRRRFRATRCGAERGTWFAIEARTSWRFALAARLTPGRYVLDAKAEDGAGNRTEGRRRGQDRVVFRVR